MKLSRRLGFGSQEVLTFHNNFEIVTHKTLLKITVFFPRCIDGGIVCSFLIYDGIDIMNGIADGIMRKDILNPNRILENSNLLERKS